MAARATGETTATIAIGALVRLEETKGGAIRDRLQGETTGAVTRGRRGEEMGAATRTRRAGTNAAGTLARLRGTTHGVYRTVEIRRLRAVTRGAVIRGRPRQSARGTRPALAILTAPACTSIQIYCMRSKARRALPCV